jgi:hypothetical protein
MPGEADGCAHSCHVTRLTGHCAWPAVPRRLPTTHIWSCSRPTPPGTPPQRHHQRHHPCHPVDTTPTTRTGRQTVHCDDIETVNTSGMSFAAKLRRRDGSSMSTDGAVATGAEPRGPHLIQAAPPTERDHTPTRPATPTVAPALSTTTSTTALPRREGPLGVSCSEQHPDTRRVTEPIARRSTPRSDAPCVVGTIIHRSIRRQVRPTG